MAGPFTFTLAPPPGLDSDNTAFADIGRWIDGSNVRPHNGGMQTIGKYTSIITLTAGQVILGLSAMVPATGGFVTMLGTVDKVWAESGGNVVDVTPSGFAGAIGYYFAPYGDSFMINPLNGSIYQYLLAGAPAVKLGAAPVPQRVTAMVVARRQVLAFGCNEELSGTFNNRCIRGCDLEDPTDWTTTSTNSAFEDILDDTGGIVAAANIGDYIAVWTATSLWMGTFVDDPSQVYRWERVTNSVGCVGQHTWCVDGGTAYWLGPSRTFWAWSPGSLPAPIPCPISNEFRANIMGEDSFASMVWNQTFNEVWLFYADNRDNDGDPTRYVAFNREGQWFKGMLARSSCFGPYGGPGAFIASRNNVVYQHDLSPDFGGDPLAWSLTAGEQYLSEGRKRVQIQRWVPDFFGQTDDISLTLYFRDRPQSATVWTKGPYTVTADDEKSDFMASGMLVTAKLSGTATGVDGAALLRIGKQTFDCVPMGDR